MRNAFLTAGFVAAFVLFGVMPSSAQLASIVFPDTAAGSTSTVKCPVSSVGLCFGGTNCTASGTVQSITGPNPPFSVGQFNLLTSTQFFNGDCTANPVTFPVTVGPGQIFAYQATFSPSAAGSFTDSLTFSTAGGSGTVTLSGRGLAKPVSSTRGLISIQTNKDAYIPGDLFELSYHITPGSSQSAVDLYLAIQMPGSPLLFFTNQGGFVQTITPFRRNVTPVDETQTLISLFIPTDLPFGTYTFYVALGVPGMTPDLSNLKAGITSTIAQVDVTYGALSPVQQSILESRGGNPDLLAVIWLPDSHQNRASWSYFSGNPVRFTFLNGALESQQALSNTPGTQGPHIDPSQINPQTTLNSLMATFGQPASIGPNADDPDFTEVHYASGLDVTLLNGHLSSATTSLP